MIIVDITDLFVKTYLDKYRDRTVDQMVQAARSCKQNIVEGSVAAATSRETEIKLTNVAKASLAELREDYLDYLRHNGLAIWGKNDQRTSAVRQFSRVHDKPEDYIQRLRQRSAETFCNIAITLCHQLDYMLYCVIERAKKIFLEKGGIREEMYRARVAARGSYQRNQSYQSYPSNQRNQSYQRAPRSYGSNNSDNSNPSNNSGSSNPPIDHPDGKILR